MKFSTVITAIFTLFFLGLSPAIAHPQTSTSQVAACASNGSCKSYYQITSDCFSGTSTTNMLSCICSKSGVQSAWEGCLKCVEAAGVTDTGFSGTWEQVCSAYTGTGTGTSSGSTTSAAAASSSSGSSTSGSKTSGGVQGIKYGSSHHAFAGLLATVGMGFFVAGF